MNFLENHEVSFRENKFAYYEDGKPIKIYDLKKFSSGHRLLDVLDRITIGGEKNGWWMTGEKLHALSTGTAEGPAGAVSTAFLDSDRSQFGRENLILPAPQYKSRDALLLDFDAHQECRCSSREGFQSLSGVFSGSNLREETSSLSQRLASLRQRILDGPGGMQHAREVRLGPGDGTRSTRSERPSSRTMPRGTSSREEAQGEPARGMASLPTSRAPTALRPGASREGHEQDPVSVVDLAGASRHREGGQEEGEGWNGSGADQEARGDHLLREETGRGGQSRGKGEGAEWLEDYAGIDPEDIDEQSKAEHGTFDIIEEQRLEVVRPGRLGARQQQGGGQLGDPDQTICSANARARDERGRGAVKKGLTQKVGKKLIFAAMPLNKFLGEPMKSLEFLSQNSRIDFLEIRAGPSEVFTKALREKGYSCLRWNCFEEDERVKLNVGLKIQDTIKNKKPRKVWLVGRYKHFMNSDDRADLCADENLRRRQNHLRNRLRDRKMINELADLAIQGLQEHSDIYWEMPRGQERKEVPGLSRLRRTAAELLGRSHFEVKIDGRVLGCIDDKGNKMDKKWTILTTDCQFAS